MELRVLKYFLTIADEQNISKAADLIHITQPTLSRQIMDLEDELGVKLFARNRQNRKFLLTDEGMRFYNYANQIVQLSEKTLDEFKNSNSEVFGKIFIGAGETKSFEAVANASSESDLTFVPLEPLVESEAVLAWRKDFRLSKQAELFLEEIKSE